MDDLSVSPADYQIVILPNGKRSLRSHVYAETMHPGLGPAAEADLLYVQQLKLPERLRNHEGEFVVWDIGLGAAANAIAFLRASRNTPGTTTLLSFDHTAEPLEFALQHKDELGYLAGYEEPLGMLLLNVVGTRCCASNESNSLRDDAPSPQPSPPAGARGTKFTDGSRQIHWQLHLTDFPKLLASPETATWPKPHAILFDAFSPARNPEMWTLPLFTQLFRLLDPTQPCALATYSRSTMIRTALLLAGFFVGRGHPSGAKEETTVAANSLSLIEDPLERAWLERARKSGSAEPLTAGVYRQAPLADQTWERLQAHRQF